MGKRVVVCGATGNQGKAVVSALLASQQWEVVALTRSTEGAAAGELRRAGARVVRADLLDRASLVEAFRGAYGVFGVTQPWSADYKKCDVASEVRQGRNIIDACLECGIEHLVLSTVMLLFDYQRGQISHVDSKLDIEAYAREKQVPMTIVRPASFMDNIGLPFFPVKRGSVRGFVAGDAKVPYVACADIGVLVAAALSRPAEVLGKEVRALGDLVSGADLAAALSKLRRGERFKYKAVPAIVLRLFAREFHQMRREFESYGRPPALSRYQPVLEETRKFCPEPPTIDAFLARRGYASKALS